MKNNTTHPEDLLTWADGTTAERSEFDRGECHYLSDDFTVIPVNERVDHFDENITVKDLYDQILIALTSMKRGAVIHYDNDALCLELDLFDGRFSQGFESALKRIATKVIETEVAGIPEGVRAFGDVSINPETGITFWGWKISEDLSEEITDEDGRWISPDKLFDVAPSPEL
ncbi:hypothetical protein [Pseudosulfitobacter pseudonitzschiae]|uniref:hypothetical protein n=1 Tax=Pseudosulfitobacter pseudonitzschiae TaxID=1402135 RepID=UPI003B793DF7